MLRVISTELRVRAGGFSGHLLSPPCTLQRFALSLAGCPFRRSAFFALHAPALRAVARGLPFPAICFLRLARSSASRCRSRAALSAGLLSSPCTLQRFALSLAGCPFRPSAFSALHAPALRAVARGLPFPAGLLFPPCTLQRFALSLAGWRPIIRNVVCPVHASMPGKQRS